MKKLVAAAVLGTTLFGTQVLAGEGSTYVGVDYLMNSTTQTISTNNNSLDKDNDSVGIKVKLGFESDTNLRMQVYLQKEAYDTAIYTYSGGNGDLLEFGVDIIKGFEVLPGLSPFIEVGAGYGMMSVDNLIDDYVGEFSLRAGGGVMYKIVPAFELVAGANYQYRKWSDIEVITIGGGTTSDTDSRSETTTRLYIGANLHF